MRQEIGFIGLGVMGHSMAGHLLDAGHSLHLYTRTPAKAAALLARDARWGEAPATLAERCEIVFTIVGYPRDVEEVYLGADGLLGAVRPGAVLVDMTTSSPELARRIAAAAAARGAAALDAPVSGGDKGAREATLSIMVGGERETFVRLQPLLRLMGKTIVHQGAAGSGQHCKLCNQIAIAGNILGVCEAVAYARATGLEPTTVLQSIADGAAGSWSLSNLAPRILRGDFAPGFFVKHFIKDMEIAVSCATQFGLDLPALELALARFRELAASGAAEAGIQALCRLYGGGS